MIIFVCSKVVVMRIFRKLILFCLVALPFVCCGQKIKEYKLQVVETLPHDRAAYTQGLFFHNGELYESCGQYGSSYFRKVDVQSGKDLRRLNFDGRYFVEGSCVQDGLLYILTWREHKCFVYDINSFKYLGELYNPREGWGLTSNGKDLILSDGTSKIYFLDPQTFAVRSSKEVKMNGKPLTFLNELEFINGEIWANVYIEDYIVIIDPATGNVKAKVDCKGLLPSSLRKPTTDVLNGIAHNPVTGEIYLTGKYWPKMYKVKLVEK